MSLIMRPTRPESGYESVENGVAKNCDVDATRKNEEERETICAANESGSTTSNQPRSLLEALELLKETEEEKKARLDMEEKVKNMLENLPFYVKRVVRTPVKPLDKSLHCKDCDVWVNSPTQMEQHLSSLRHKNTLAGIPVPPRVDKIEPVKPKSIYQYKCELCHNTLNSEVQLYQHLCSQRHIAALEGKPPKRRWVPYEQFRAHKIIQARLRQQSAYTVAYQPILMPNFTHLQMGQLGHSQLGAMQNVQNVPRLALPPGMPFDQFM